MAVPCSAQAPATPKSAAVAKTAASDMEMPDDLGAPMAETTTVATGSKRLSINTPIALIAANPLGKAVLERRLPGLCERPEYAMFKGMSLSTLASLSHGRINTRTLAQVQLDLARVSPAGVELTNDPVRRHNPFTQGSRSIGRLSHSLYRRVVMVIAAL